MSWTLMLNDDVFEFSADDLPALVHGEKHSGAAFFTLQLVSELYRQGEPLLFFSPATQAKDELLTQLGSDITLPTITTIEDVENASSEQALHFSEEGLFSQLVATLPDLQERVVIIFGFETIQPETIRLLSGHAKTIFFGDLNTSSAKELLLQWKYNAKIFFSPLHNDFRLTLPPLEQYHGYFQGRISQGTVFLSENT